jgi:hypothetical protein
MATRPQELRDFDRFVRTCFPDQVVGDVFDVSLA